MTHSNVRAFLRGRVAPGFASYQPTEGSKGWRLDAANTVLSEKGLWLHATRGFRRLNVQLTVASQITEAIKRGEHVTLKYMREEMQAARKTQLEYDNKRLFQKLRRHVT